MTWDFAEANPFSSSGGNFVGNLDFVAKVVQHAFPGVPGRAQQLDARLHVAAEEQAVVATDPPYYDNIGYADLSDFFYGWLRRSLGPQYPSLFTTLVTPKQQELIASPYRHGGSKERSQLFFEEGLGAAFSLMRNIQAGDFPLSVYYAFKQSESEEEEEGDETREPSTVSASTGWETMLAGLIRAGFSIHGTWPMRTERSTSTTAQGRTGQRSSNS
jgi:putative DNA methylase